MKSFNLVLFAGLMILSVASNASVKGSSRKDDTNLKSIRPANCAMRGSFNLSDCTDSSCQKTTGVRKKGGGVDGNVKAGG